MKKLLILSMLIGSFGSLQALQSVPAPDAKSAAAQLEADRKSAAITNYVDQARGRSLAAQAHSPSLAAQTSQLKEAVRAYQGESLDALAFDSKEEKLWQERVAVAQLKFKSLLEQTVAYENGDKRDAQILRELASLIAAHFVYMASLIGHTKVQDAHMVAAAQKDAARYGRGIPNMYPNAWITNAHYPQTCAAAQSAFAQSMAQVQSQLTPLTQQNILKAYTTVAKPTFFYQHHSQIPGSRYGLPEYESVDQCHTQLAKSLLAPQINQHIAAAVPGLLPELRNIVTEYCSLNFAPRALLPFIAMNDSYRELELPPIDGLDGLDAVVGADEIKHLALSHNQLHDIPVGVFNHYMKLTSLSMDSCGLRTVPLDELIATCGELDRVDLSNNAIARVEDLGPNFETALQMHTPQGGSLMGKYERDPITGALIPITGTRFWLRLAGNPIAQNEVEKKRLQAIFKSAGKNVIYLSFD
jgi:hypothetical protein